MQHGQITENEMESQEEKKVNAMTDCEDYYCYLMVYYYLKHLVVNDGTQVNLQVNDD